jgi:rod shape-determining protein MreC
MKNSKIALSKAIEKNNECIETELSNQRFRTFLNFQKTMTNDTIAAQVIGKDPSPWFKSIIIDKGFSDGVKKGLPVIIPEGAAGQIIEVTKHYSKVLLLIDRNSAIDSLAQRTRARGIIRGSSDGRFFFNMSSENMKSRRRHRHIIGFGWRFSKRIKGWPSPKHNPKKFQYFPGSCRHTLC